MMQSISSCHRGEVFYTRQVRLCQRELWLLWLAAWPLVFGGCSGINASQSVSPASFFLPGLLKNECPTDAPALEPEISIEFATVR